MSSLIADVFWAFVSVLLATFLIRGFFSAKRKAGQIAQIVIGAAILFSFVYVWGHTGKDPLQWGWCYLYPETKACIGESFPTLVSPDNVSVETQQSVSGNVQISRVSEAEFSEAAEEIALNYAYVHLGSYSPEGNALKEQVNTAKSILIDGGLTENQILISNSCETAEQRLNSTLCNEGPFLSLTLMKEEEAEHAHRIVMYDGPNFLIEDRENLLRRLQKVLERF